MPEKKKRNPGMCDEPLVRRFIANISAFGLHRICGYFRVLGVFVHELIGSQGGFTG